jgi:hypothetical protein
VSFEVEPSLSQSTSRRTIDKTGAKLAYAAPLVAASMRMHSASANGVVSGPPTCAAGEALDDGRCFLAYPNCGSCGVGFYGVAAGGSDINFCTPTYPTGGQSCSHTADCPAGQWCAIVDGVNLFCVPGCNAA